MGPPELMIILVIIGIVFGAGWLPQVMEALGHGMKMFREASSELDDAVNEVKQVATAEADKVRYEGREDEA
jgi:sec-independent protein translocase protein TatA